MKSVSSLSFSSLWSACLGNLFEHYDNALFGFLSPFLAPLIFPTSDPIVALILTYAMIPLGMAARPLGALFFGQLADRKGRGRALSLSLLGMGIVSALFAWIPLYETIGWASPLLFTLGRILQNFFAAGESMNGAIYLLEKNKEENKDFVSSLYNASTIAGLLLASFGVACLSSHWRWLYLIGSFTALFGAWIRKRTKDENVPVNRPLNPIQTVKKEWRAFLTIVLISGFAYANYSIALVFMNGFVPLIAPVTKESMALLNSSLLIFDLLLLPLAGLVAAKISREKVMLFSALFIILSAIPLFNMLVGASFWTIVLVRILFVAAGVLFFAPFHAFAASLVPKESRGMIISLGYAVGSQLLGGPTAAISTTLFKMTGLAWTAALYWLLLALFTAIKIQHKRLYGSITQT